MTDLFPSYNFSGLAGTGAVDYSALASPVGNFNAMSGFPTTVDGLGASGLPAIGGGGMGAMGIANAGISGLQALGSLWMGFKAAKLAKKQFKFTKDITNTNLANQIKTYNTALSDRARSRGVMEGQSQDQVNNYVNSNSLSRNQTQPTGYTNNYREGGPGGSVVATPTAASVSSLSSLASRVAAERGRTRDDEPVRA